MRFAFANFANALVVAGLAALGGALAVFAEYDDSPGGVLIGFALIVAGVAFGARAARRSE